MTNDTIREIIKQLSKLKDVDRDTIIDILLGYIGNEYDLNRIVNEILELNNITVRGL